MSWRRTPVWISLGGAWLALHAGYVNAIGYLCEAAWHHADLSVTWGKLWVKLKTHDAGGITDKDFALAKQIEGIVLWRPADGPLAPGNPKKFVFSK